MDDEVVKNIPFALNLSLSLDKLLGLWPAFNQAYVRIKLAYYFNSNSLYPFGIEVGLQITNKVGPGRPHQLDFGLFNLDYTALVAVFEIAWISKTPYNPQRLIDDLLRLRCSQQNERDVARFFLVAGSVEYFEKNFRYHNANIYGARRSFAEEVLSFSLEIPKKFIRINRLDEQIRVRFENFGESYKTSVPKLLKTSLISRDESNDIAIWMWRVSG